MNCLQLVRVWFVVNMRRKYSYKISKYRLIIKTRTHRYLCFWQFSRPVNSILVTLKGHCHPIENHCRRTSVRFFRRDLFSLQYAVLRLIYGYMYKYGSPLYTVCTKTCAVRNSITVVCNSKSSVFVIFFFSILVFLTWWEGKKVYSFLYVVILNIYLFYISTNFEDFCLILISG